MIEIKYKPLSVNEVWQGKRFKTPAYNKYQRDILLLLPKILVPKGDLCLEVEFGFSSLSSDIDNCLKPFIDILQKKFSFNDKLIRRLVVEKTHVKKGDEYIKFIIKNYGKLD